MKKNIIFLMALFTISLISINCKAEIKNIKINNTNFPSESLRNFISKEVDRNRDGLISEDERLVIKLIAINNISDEEDDSIDNKAEYEKLSEEEKYQRYKMIDLKGVEMFPNIEEINLVVGDKLDNLNKINKLTKLKKISFGNVHKKINYNFSKIKNLRSLSLKEMDCKDVTIKGNSKLSKVDLYMVKANKITINNNKKLKKINTEFLRIKNFQCKNNKLLKEMEIYGDMSFGTYKKSNSIKKMYIHNNPKLKSVDIRYFKKLKKVDLVKNKNLRALELDCTPSLKKVFLKKNKSSRKLKVEKNGQKIRIYKNK